MPMSSSLAGISTSTIYSISQCSQLSNPLRTVIACVSSGSGASSVQVLSKPSESRQGFLLRTEARHSSQAILKKLRGAGVKAHIEEKRIDLKFRARPWLDFAVASQWIRQTLPLLDPVQSEELKNRLNPVCWFRFEVDCQVLFSAFTLAGLEFSKGSEEKADLILARSLEPLFQCRTFEPQSKPDLVVCLPVDIRGNYDLFARVGSHGIIFGEDLLGKVEEAEESLVRGCLFYCYPECLRRGDFFPTLTLSLARLRNIESENDLVPIESLADRLENSFRSIIRKNLILSTGQHMPKKDPMKNKERHHYSFEDVVSSLREVSVLLKDKGGYVRKRQFCELVYDNYFREVPRDVRPTAHSFRQYLFRLCQMEGKKPDKGLQDLFRGVGVVDNLKNKRIRIPFSLY